MAGQSEARLVFYGDRLVAILTRLDETHDDMKGRWYAECCFNGLERMQESTFESLDAAVAWMRPRLDHEHKA